MAYRTSRKREKNASDIVYILVKNMNVTLLIHTEGQVLLSPYATKLVSIQSKC